MSGNEKKIDNVLTDTTPRGVVLNMDREAYDAIERLNMSSICPGILEFGKIDTSAIRHAFERRNRKITQATQDQWDRGTLAHMLLLQPERIESDVAVWYGDRRAGGEWDKFNDDNRGRLVIREQDFTDISAACTAFRFHPKVTELLSDLDAEVAVISEDRGVKTKGLIDAVTRGDKCKIIDLKTTDVRPTSRSCQRLIRDFHNREKMAAYRGWYQIEARKEVVECINLFLYMQPPYAIRIVRFSDEALEFGDLRYMEAIARVKDAITANHWPIYCATDVAKVAEFEMPAGEEEQIEW